MKKGQKWKTFTIPEEKRHRRHIVAESFKTRLLRHMEKEAENEQTAEKESI